MKIAVYSIALNEAKHVERWAGSAVAADYRLVGDTGSTDGTPEMLRASGAEVHDIRIRPWRFDDARNAALSLLPADTDICVSLDLDRYLLPNWRGAVESAWKDDVDRLYHKYSVRFDEAGKTLWATRGSCIHARFGYRWFRRVHEDVRRLGGEERPAWVEQDIIGDLPDGEKPRNYLSLLEEEHRDNPEDPLILYNLARDLLFDRQHEKSLQGFKQYLQLPRATWPAERSQAMIYLAKLEQKNQTEWLLRAYAESPTRREVCLCLAERFLQLEDWAGVFWAARPASPGASEPERISMPSPPGDLASPNSRRWRDIGSACPLERAGELTRDPTGLLAWPRDEANRRKLVAKKPHEAAICPPPLLYPEKMQEAAWVSPGRSYGRRFSFRC